MPCIKLSKTNLYYELITNNSGRLTILFIHGLGSSTRDWHNQVEYFRSYYDIITVDLHGFGQSDRTQRQLTIHDYAQDILELIEHLHVEKPHIIGLSLGAMVCYEIATSYPHLIRSAVFINALPEFIPRSFKEKLNVIFRFAIIRLLGMKILGKVLSKKLFTHSHQQPLKDEFLQHWSRNKRKNYIAAMKAILNWSVVSKLDRVNIPTLIIAAEHDYTTIESKQKFAAMLPNTTVTIIENSWHATPVDQPDKLNKALMTFLENI